MFFGFGVSDSWGLRLVRCGCFACGTVDYVWFGFLLIWCRVLFDFVGRLFSWHGFGG